MHSWDLTPKEAVRLQKELRDRVRTDLTLKHPETVAGVDVAYHRASRQSVAAVAVLTYPALEPVESAVARSPTRFPYVPGLLSFREMPAILKAVEQLESLPDLIFVDGHGRAHPRRFGIASHLGLWLRVPAIGIGKSRLCGEYVTPDLERGSWTDLIHRGEIIGRVLRTRAGVKPVFVSVGYGLSLGDSMRWTVAVTPRFRLPEPIRLADGLCRLSKSGIECGFEKLEGIKSIKG